MCALQSNASTDCCVEFPVDCFQALVSVCLSVQWLGWRFREFVPHGCQGNLRSEAMIKRLDFLVGRALSRLWCMGYLLQSAPERGEATGRNIFVSTEALGINGYSRI